MKIKRKLEIVELSLRSISEHKDADSTVRIAALTKCAEMVEREQEKVRAQAMEAASQIE